MASALSFLNFPVQSGGAAVMMELLRILPSDLTPTLLCHDGFVFEVDQKIVRDAAAVVKRKMVEASKTIFPDVNVRVDLQAAFRFFKDDPASLHKFFAKRGLILKTDVGFVADLRGL